MSKTRFYVDEKVTVWRRTWYSLDEEKTNEQIVESVRVNDISHDIDNSEILYETEEYMFPVDNGGQSTIEIYSDDGKGYKLLWNNGEPFEGVQNL